uniref:Uncharacterized protein n=1 Tax=Oryza rufipogon TaxID=4529 RepID=A0A0E0QNJ7_ORYRU
MMHVAISLMWSGIPTVASYLTPRKRQASGGVPNSKLPSYGDYVPDSKDEASGGIPNSKLPPSGGFVPDFKDEASGGVPDPRSLLPHPPFPHNFIPNSEDQDGVSNSKLPPSPLPPLLPTPMASS